MFIDERDVLLQRSTETCHAYGCW